MAMSKVFRARFIEELEAALPEHVPKDLRSELFGKNWVVYAKRPFESVHSAIEYLGRYTHKIAISNHRLVNISDDKVTFSYKDYKDEGKKKEMTLETTEFVRRFALHILPRAFVRIRHYGIVSNAAKQQSIPLIRSLLPEQKTKKKKGAKPEHFNPRICPCCKKETLEKLIKLKHRGPPTESVLQTAAGILKMIS
jgi:hypothetical protein